MPARLSVMEPCGIICLIDFIHLNWSYIDIIEFNLKKSYFWPFFQYFSWTVTFITPSFSDKEPCSTMPKISIHFNDAIKTQWLGILFQYNIWIHVVLVHQGGKQVSTTKSWTLQEPYKINTSIFKFVKDL